MSKSRRRRSRATPPAAKKRRRVHYDARLNEITPALLPRKFTARKLNCSLATLLRMEEQGILDRVRLMNSPNAQVYHRAEQVERLVQGEKA
jgi:hypothetical protein